LRFVLGCVEALLCLRIHRSRLRTPPAFFACMAFCACADLLPAFPWMPGWWRLIWAPLATIRLMLAIAASAGIFSWGIDITWRGIVVSLQCASAQMYAEERTNLLLFAAAAGALPAVAGFHWQPTNGFQGFAILRQYAALALAAGFSAAWYYARSMRPLQIAPAIARHGLLWACWLWSGVLMAITTKGGLLWLLAPWEGHLWLWRLVSDIGLLIQVGLVSTWLTACQQDAEDGPPPFAARRRVASSR